MADYSPFGSLAPMVPPDRDAMGSIYGARDGLAQMQFPSWYQGSFGALSPSPFLDAPPSRQDAAFQTSIDRWKQLAKDAFFAPADALKAFNEKPTFGNALGIMPMGTFAGPLAKTADRAALSTAERLAGKGAAREEIWDKTGWFQGPDQKWRFEIPDNASSFKKPLQEFYDQETAKYGHQAQETWLPNIFEHKALYEAYPEMNRARLFVGDSRSGKARGAYQGTDMDGSHLIGIQPKEGRTTMLHELQHAIQNDEGFARGGSPSTIPKSMIDYERKRIVENAKDNGWANVGTMAGDSPDSVFAHSLYNRLAGEVEARAVQNRMDLTPAQRSARPPWLDYDIPAEQQFVMGAREMAGPAPIEAINKRLSELAKNLATTDIGDPQRQMLKAAYDALLEQRQQIVGAGAR